MSKPVRLLPLLGLALGIAAIAVALAIPQRQPWVSQWTWLPRALFVLAGLLILVYAAIVLRGCGWVQRVGERLTAALRKLFVVRLTPAGPWNLEVGFGPRSGHIVQPGSEWFYHPARLAYPWMGGMPAPILRNLKAVVQFLSQDSKGHYVPRVTVDPAIFLRRERDIEITREVPDLRVLESVELVLCAVTLVHGVLRAFPVAAWPPQKQDDGYFGIGEWRCEVQLTGVRDDSYRLSQKIICRLVVKPKEVHLER